MEIIIIVYEILKFIFGFIFSCFYGIIILFLSSTKQTKITMCLCLSVTYVDLYYIYPFTGNHPIHVLILFAPAIYLSRIGKGETS